MSDKVLTESEIPLIEAGIAIDTKWLRAKNACSQGYEWFLDTYGDKAPDVEAVLRKLVAENHDDWASWLVSACGKTNVVIEVEASISVRAFYTTGSLIAGSGIKAGSGIEAGSGIKAGWGIKAGEGIKAGWGIEAGLSISAKFISATLRIFAGVCGWKIPSSAECEIRAEIKSGVVAHGTVITPNQKEDAPIS